MKRSFNLFLVFIIIVVFNQSLVVANQLDNPKPEITTNSKPLNKFTITNGLENKAEYTFDDKRTITGVADKDSVVTIYLLDKTANADEFKELKTITVGKSEIFSIEVDLQLGDNIIKVEAVNKNLQNQVLFKINRLDIEVKAKLETIVLPNQKFNFKDYID